MRATTSVDLASLGFARREEDVEPSTGRRLLQRFGSIRNLGEVSPEVLREELGLEGFEALRCLALMELGRRVGEAGKGEEDQLDSAQDVSRRLRWLRNEKKEHFLAILLDSQNRVMREATIHVGTLTMSLVGPREVFREAVREGASSIIVAHNHPSGDPQPSPEDIEVTKQLVEVGKMLDIPVLDHVIIGDPDFWSLKQRGLM